MTCPDEARPGSPVVNVVTSHEIVGAGIQCLLERCGVTSVAINMRPDTQPNIVLYDVLGLHEGDGHDFNHWVKTSAVVIALSRELRPDLGASAAQLGADAVVSLGVSADQLASVIESALAGGLRQHHQVQRATAATRLGHEAGLALRESQVLALIVRGLSNHDIADACSLSINSVKSYIRSAYRKIGVTSRTQAVAWGVQHGFALMDAPSRPRNDSGHSAAMQQHTSAS